MGPILNRRHHGARHTFVAKGILMAILTCVSPSWATTTCPDYLVSEPRLASILQTALGSASSFVREKRVKIEPANAACYLQMSLRLGGQLGGLPIECTLSGCSTAVFDGRQIGIRQFDVHGCEAAFDFLGLSHTVNTSYADVTIDIETHCGSRAFAIADAIPELSGGRGLVRLKLQSSGP